MIDKVVLKRPAPDKCEVRIIWKGGNWSTAEFPLPVVTITEMANGEQLVSEVLRRARAGQRDEQIAEEMTAAGYHAPLRREPGCRFGRADPAPTWRLQPQDRVPSPRSARMDHPGPGGRAAWRAQSVGLLPDSNLAVTNRSRLGNRAVLGPRQQASPQEPEGSTAAAKDSPSPWNRGHHKALSKVHRISRGGGACVNSIAICALLESCFVLRPGSVLHQQGRTRGC